MASFNSLVLLGNLGRDPEVRTLSSGTSVAVFSVAASRLFKDKDGNNQQETDWIPCEAWGKTADLISQLLHKGDSVIVSGPVREERWEQDGQKRSKLKLRVENFQKLNRKGEDSSSTPPAAEENNSGTDEGTVTTPINGDGIPF